MTSPATPPLAQLRQQVFNTELAFAHSMAERQLAAFAALVADDAVFFSGDTVLRGKAAVVAAWAAYFDGPAAPFAWAPQTVEVLGTGALALSTGPVTNPQGRLIAHFTSIWRLAAPGQWRIVFDKGSPVGG